MERVGCHLQGCLFPARAVLKNYCCALRGDLCALILPAVPATRLIAHTTSLLSYTVTASRLHECLNASAFGNTVSLSAGTPALWTSWPGRKGVGAASSTARRFRYSRDGSRERPGIIQRFRSGTGNIYCFCPCSLLRVVFTSTTCFRLRNCEVVREQPR